MFRQSSGRSQRNKGFRVKHGLQIFLLIAVSGWLLYQVKHSHDKRQALDESGANVSGKIEETGNDLFTLGRKDLTDRIQMVTDKPKEEEEEEEDKPEGRGEEEEEEEEGHEENEEEERGDGDDEIDDVDREKIDEDAEQEEEVVDGEEEKEKDDDKDNELDNEMWMFATDEDDNGGVNSRDRESSSQGLIHDTQIIRSDIARSEQEKVNGEGVEGESDHDKERGGSFSEPDPDKEEKNNATSLKTITEESAIKEDELSRSESLAVLREGDGVDDSAHNVTGNEAGGVRLLSESMADRNTTHLDSMDPSDSEKNSTLNEGEGVDDSAHNVTGNEAGGVRLLSESMADRNTTHLDSIDRSESEKNSTLNDVLQDGESASEGDHVVSEDKNITLSQNGDRNATLSEMGDDNSTLSEDSDPTKTQSEEETDATEIDSGGGETEERSELVARGADSSNFLTNEEERDALAVLATLPQHDGEGINDEVGSAE